MSASSVEERELERHKMGVKFKSLYPSKPVKFSAMECPTAEAVQEFFDGIEFKEDVASIDDSSVTKSCKLFIGSPVITKGMRESTLALSLLIDDGLSLMDPPKNLLGLQHARDLCERYNSSVASPHFSREKRIWFYGFYVQGERRDEYHSLMAWNNETRLWEVQMAPVCDYRPVTDYIAFGHL